MQYTLKDEISRDVLLDAAMNAVWIGLTTVGVLAGLAAGIWFMVLAFKESLGWGIACLFGIPCVVFVVRYWEDVKGPFFGAMAGSLVAVIGLVGFSVSSVNAQLGGFDDLDDSNVWDARPLTIPNEIDSEESAVSDVMQSHDNRSSHEDSMPVTSDEQNKPTSITDRRRGMLVPFEDVQSYVGERVVLKLKNDEQIYVYIVAFDGDNLDVLRSVGGGSMTFTVNLNEIEEIRARKAR